MSRERTILVTGAYGAVGRELVSMLVEKTDARVIATGRKTERLASLPAEFEPGRVETQVLDALDPMAVRAACSRAGLLINCVGPYLESGEGVARVAIEAGASYVDFASEQVHYQRLKELAPSARERGSFLLTGAGVVPGLSAVLALRGAEQLPSVDSVEIIFAQPRMPAADAGLGSILTGVLEEGHWRTARRSRDGGTSAAGTRRRYRCCSAGGSTRIVTGPSSPADTRCLLRKRARGQTPISRRCWRSLRSRIS